MIGLLNETTLADAAERLAPLPAATTRLTTLLGDRDVNMHEVVDVITYDPVLTAALLRQANSAHSAAARAVTNVRDAVVRLGLSTVVSLAMRMAVAHSFQKSLPIYGLKQGEVFTHSVKAAVAAEVLRQKAPARVPAATPTVALLHDVGKILISDVMGDRTVALVDQVAQADRITVVDAEVEVFGMHHGQVGSHVIRRWNLPLTFLEGLANHHGPAGCGSSIATSVQLCDEIAHALVDDETEDGTEPQWPPRDSRPIVPSTLATRLCELTGIDPQIYPGIVETTLKRYEWVRNAMG